MQHRVLFLFNLNELVLSYLGVVSISDATPTPVKDETGTEGKEDTPLPLPLPAVEEQAVTVEKGVEDEGHDIEEGRGSEEGCGTVANTELGDNVNNVEVS